MNRQNNVQKKKDTKNNNKKTLYRNLNIGCKLGALEGLGIPTPLVAPIVLLLISHELIKHFFSDQYRKTIQKLKR